MIAILVLITVGTIFFLGLFAGIRCQDARREQASARRRRNASVRVHAYRPRTP